MDHLDKAELLRADAGELQNDLSKSLLPTAAPSPQLRPPIRPKSGSKPKT